MKHVPPGVTSAPRPLGPCGSRCPPSPSAAASDWRGRASHDMWKIPYFLVVFGGFETEFHGSGSILAMFSRFWKLLDGFHPQMGLCEGVHGFGCVVGFKWRHASHGSSIMCFKRRPWFESRDQHISSSQPHRKVHDRPKSETFRSLGWHFETIYVQSSCVTVKRTLRGWRNKR